MPVEPVAPPPIQPAAAATDHDTPAPVPAPPAPPPPILPASEPASENIEQKKLEAARKFFKRKKVCDDLKLQTLSSFPERTARRWLRRLGLKCMRRKKGYYYDGHERADVLRERRAFLDELLEFLPRMKHYDEILDVSLQESGR